MPPLPPPPDATARRAAAMVWILGLLEVVLCSCCVVSCLFLAGLNEESIQTLGKQYQSPEMVKQAQSLAFPMAILTVMLGLLPGVGYVVLGFGVRQRKMPAVNTCLLLAMTQGIVLGVLLLLQVVEAVRTLSPMLMTTTALTHGTPMALIVYVIRLLMSLRAGGEQDLETDPWNQAP
jgi:hypothetical protein